MKPCDEGVMTPRSRLRGRLVRMPVLALLAILPACGTMTGLDVRRTAEEKEATRVWCETNQPIYWSRSDTRETVEQIKEYNATGYVLCGWRSTP